MEEAEDSEAAVLVIFYKIEMTGKQPIPPVPEKWQKTYLLNCFQPLRLGGRGAFGRGRGMVRDAKGPDWDCSGTPQSTTDHPN